MTTRLHILILLLFAALAPPLPAQHVAFTEIGHWTEGPVHAVAAEGDIVYFGGSANLQIADFADPSAPVALGRVDLGGVVWAIAPAGEHAYVAQRSGDLSVVDISDADAPQAVNALALDGKLSDVAVRGPWLYVLEVGRGFFDQDLTLYIYDVSDPAAPALVGETTAGERAGLFVPARMDVVDGYAYVCADESLRIIDISDPANPAEIGIFETRGYAASPGAVDVVGNYAYINSVDSLRVLDVSDPSAPTRIAVTQASTGATALRVAGDYAYVTDRFREKGLHVVDVSDPANPVEVGVYEMEGNAEVFGAVVSGGRAYLAADYRGVLVLDVSDPASPSEAGVLVAGGETINVLVNGDYAFATVSTDASLNSGSGAAAEALWVADISTPGNPETVATLQVDGSNEGSAAQGSLVGMARGSAGLKIIDASNPVAPIVAGTFEKNTWAVAADDTYFYALTGDGFSVVDAADPANPQEIASIGAGDRTFEEMAVQGNYAYLSIESPDGLLLLDLSDPAAPEEAGFVSLSEEPGLLAVGGGYAYVTSASSFEDILRVIDVSDPAHPTLYETIETDGGLSSPDAITFRNGFLYVSSGIYVYAYEVTAPAELTEVEYYEISGGAKGFTFAGDMMYVAASEAGFVILSVEAGGSGVESVPERAALAGLSAVTPNPFTARTAFMLRVARAQHVRLAVYDVLGRRVATLHDGLLSAGEPRPFTFDATDLPSGIYFLHAAGEHFTATRRMAHLK